jgi:hypothetical protein
MKISIVIVNNLMFWHITHINITTTTVITK